MPSPTCSALWFGFGSNWTQGFKASCLHMSSGLNSGFKLIVSTYLIVPFGVWVTARAGGSWGLEAESRACKPQTTTQLPRGWGAEGKHLLYHTENHFKSNDRVPYLKSGNAVHKNNNPIRCKNWLTILVELCPVWVHIYLFIFFPCFCHRFPLLSNQNESKLSE